MSEELAQTAAKFEKLYRETPAMLHSIDPDGMLVEVSDYWLQQMGYDSRDAVLGRHIAEFHSPEHGLHSPERVSEFWRSGKPFWNRHCEFQRKDGTIFEADLSVVITRPKGEASGQSLSVIFDVTERNRAKRQLEKKNNELERLNEELDTFASVASHDLQEPLRKIRRFSEIVEEDVGDRLSEDGAYAVRVMRGAAARMQRLIDDLLVYAQTANAVIDPEPVDLGDVVDQVKDDLSMVILEAGAKVTAGALPRVQGNAAQLRQLFQNLIENAVKYRDPARPCKVQVRAEWAEAEKAWLVSVEDNGIGFDPDAADRIFMPFSRLHSRSVSAGSGLGLTICGRIADRHGWSIRAHGSPDGGATFTIEIPAAAT